MFGNPKQSPKMQTVNTTAKEQPVNVRKPTMNRR